MFEQQHVLKGTALGELDHPNYSSKYFKSLNLPNVSHQVGEEALPQYRCIRVRSYVPIPLHWV